MKTQLILICLFLLDWSMAIKKKDELKKEIKIVQNALKELEKCQTVLSRLVKWDRIYKTRGTKHMPARETGQAFYPIEQQDLRKSEIKKDCDKKMYFREPSFEKVNDNFTKLFNKIETIREIILNPNNVIPDIDSKDFQEEHTIKEGEYKSLQNDLFVRELALANQSLNDVKKETQKHLEHLLQTKLIYF